MCEHLNFSGLRHFETAVILVNYNSVDDTVECVKSIIETTKNKPFIIVLDNASKDQESLKSKLLFYSHLHLILSDKNVGFGGANNAAINWIFENIQCDYMFILNNDTILTDGLI